MWVFFSFFVVGYFTFHRLILQIWMSKKNTVVQFPMHNIYKNYVSKLLNTIWRSQSLLENTILSFIKYTKFKSFHDLSPDIYFTFPVVQHYCQILLCSCRLAVNFTVATMTWLTVMEYLCHKWPRICSSSRKHFPVLSSLTTHYRVCNIDTTVATSGTGTAYPPGVPAFIPSF